MKFEKRYDIDNIPVYHGKLSDAVKAIREILKGYQHDMVIRQNENNGATTSVEVTIVLKN